MCFSDGLRGHTWDVEKPQNFERRNSALPNADAETVLVAQSLAV